MELAAPLSLPVAALSRVRPEIRRPPSPSHHCVDTLLSPRLFQLLPKTRVCVNLEASQRWGLSQPFGAFKTFSTRWLVYLGLRLPRHGFEQLVKMWPVALGVPARFVQRWQSFAVFHIANWRMKEADANVWAESQPLHGRRSITKPC